MKQFIFISILAVILLVAILFVTHRSTEEKPPQVLNTSVHMKIESSNFKNNESIPSKHTCDGSDINPLLTISGTPTEAKSLALIMDDPDSPSGTWVHWTIWNMDPTLTTIDEKTTPKGVEGTTSFNTLGYGGPCPGSGTHHYHFKLYAMDTMLDLPAGATKDELETAMEGHVLAFSDLIGLYKRK